MDHIIYQHTADQTSSNTEQSLRYGLRELNAVATAVHSRRYRHSSHVVAAAAADTWAVAHIRRHNLADIPLAEGTRRTAAAEDIHRIAAAGSSLHIAVGQILAGLIFPSTC